MVDSADPLDKLARTLKTEALVDFSELSAEPCRNQIVVEYLRSANLSRVAVLDDGQVLVSPKTYLQGRKVANMIKNHGLAGRIRPASDNVIDLVRAKMEKEEASQDEDTVATSEETATRTTDVQRLLYSVVESALVQGCSDIHWITDERNNLATLKFRDKKDLVPQTQLTEKEVMAMAAMAVDHQVHEGGGSSNKEFDPNEPVDCSFEVPVQGNMVKLRYSHQPMKDPDGLSIVMRLVTGAGLGRVPDFRELGYSVEEIALQERMFNFPHGIVLYTGPTGSGKSSSMAAGVNTIPETKNIIAYEDPVEVSMPNVRQVQVGATPSTSMAAYARSGLRQDPDVMIYGEIRDAEVAEQARNQANTGHLVLSTLHTNSATGAIRRLVDLGLDWETLGSPAFLRAIVAQRLVKRVCPSCSLPLVEVLETPELVTQDHFRIHRHFKSLSEQGVDRIRIANPAPHGCQVCNDSGHTGLAPIIEIILLDTAGRELIRRGDIAGWVQHLNGHETERSLDTPFGIATEVFDYREFEQSVREAEEERIARITQTQVSKTQELAHAAS